MAMTNEDMVNVVLPDEVEIPATNAVGESVVRVWLVLSDFKGEMVMGDDDFFVLVSSGFELVLKPGPLRSGVILKFGEIADQGDGVQENEMISLMAEGAVVTDVVVLSELLQGLDAADVVVPREKVNRHLEIGQGFLESLDFVVEPIELNGM